MKRLVGKFLYIFGKRMPSSAKRLFGRVFKGYRRMCAKLILHKCGKNVNIEKGAVFSSSVELGDNSGLGLNAFLQGKVIIGRDVMMGPNVSIYTRNHASARLDIPMNQQGMTPMRPVVIGDDVWIGAGVIILPGAKIGKGCILGAGCVVRGEFPDYAVLVGNPAKVIKFRNEKNA